MFRAQLREGVARALRQILAHHDVDQADIAAATTARSSIVQRWCDVSREETISLADVVLTARARPAVAHDLLSWAADQLGLVVVAQRTASSASDLFGLLGGALDAAHGVQRAVVDAINPAGDDGAEVTERELEEIAARAARLEQVAIETRHAAESEIARRAGVASVARRMS